ncbi:FIG00496002: hypothetical protein [hydrothermal vent metagenome]|uniref:HTH domain of SpoOJ/ParA/ParB/repB family, involved in chromosome partitioning n=1 Tax=hydrothermal vent metagenome TaxID=652676 RepID=A0A3B1CK75_9ZZZZ
MAVIAPFKGVVYKRGVGSSLIDALAPPYDVIPPETQEELYEKSDRNVIRLILGKEFPDDNDADSRYTRAAGFLRDWMKDGTLERVEHESIYLYSQEYEIDNRRLKRVGVICRTKIEEFGKSIFPHERTLSGPKTDRLNLTRACRMNFSQVFGIYSDPKLTLDAIWEGIMKSAADMDVTDESGVKHRLWMISDPDVIERARLFFLETQIVIADGHHRYETALNYRNERRSQEGTQNSEAGYEHVMMFLSNCCGEGFTVLPTHRIVKDIGAVDIDDAVEKLKSDFEISERSVDANLVSGFLDDLKKSGDLNPSLGLYRGDGRMLLLSLRKDAALPNPPGNEKAAILRRLDVILLQELVFEKALGISKEAVADKKIVGYTIDAVEAMRQVDRGAARLSFIMNPTRMDQVIEVATSGGVMPQKSTYFYPKLISGLVFNPLE